MGLVHLTGLDPEFVQSFTASMTNTLSGLSARRIDELNPEDLGDVSSSVQG